MVVNLVLYLFYFFKILLLLFIHYVPPNRNLDYYFVILVILQKFGLLDFKLNKSMFHSYQFMRAMFL